MPEQAYITHIYTLKKVLCLIYSIYKHVHINITNVPLQAISDTDIQCIYLYTANEQWIDDSAVTK